MGSSLVQLLVLAGVVVFLISKLKSVLGTRDGFEPDALPRAEAKPAGPQLTVIEGGGVDEDIADHVDVDSSAGKALASMKVAEDGFNVTEFLGGASGAYEMILMAFEGGDLTTLRQFLSDDVYDSFEGVIQTREKEGLLIEAEFIGVREMKLKDATYNKASGEGEMKIRFVGELTSVVKDNSGEIVEGNPNEVKRQADTWTFARVMGSNDPNWRLVATGE